MILGTLIGMFVTHGFPIAAVLLCGFVIFGFKRLGFSLPIKIFLVVMALITLVTEFILYSVLAFVPLFVISCFLVFGLRRINLRKPALVTLGLVSGIVAVLTFFAMGLTYPFYIPH